MWIATDRNKKKPKAASVELRLDRTTASIEQDSISKDIVAHLFLLDRPDGRIHAYCSHKISTGSLVVARTSDLEYQLRILSCFHNKKSKVVTSQPLPYSLEAKVESARPIKPDKKAA